MRPSESDLGTTHALARAHNRAGREVAPRPSGISTLLYVA